jgi:hypothetical protein
MTGLCDTSIYHEDPATYPPREPESSECRVYVQSYHVSYFGFLTMLDTHESFQQVSSKFNPFQ